MVIEESTSRWAGTILCLLGLTGWAKLRFHTILACSRDERACAWEARACGARARSTRLVVTCHKASRPFAFKAPTWCSWAAPPDRCPYAWPPGRAAMAALDTPGPPSLASAFTALRRRAPDGDDRPRTAQNPPSRSMSPPPPSTSATRCASRPDRLSELSGWSRPPTPRITPSSAKQTPPYYRPLHHPARPVGHVLTENLSAAWRPGARYHLRARPHQLLLPLLSTKTTPEFT